MRHFVDDVELFDGDLVNFVEHVDAGDVDAVVKRRRQAKTTCHIQLQDKCISFCISRINLGGKKN